MALMSKQYLESFDNIDDIHVIQRKSFSYIFIISLITIQFLGNLMKKHTK